MVAAWINADTGVGPAIASGNQVYNGICALLPVAPTNSNNVMTVISVAVKFGQVCSTEHFIIRNCTQFCNHPENSHQKTKSPIGS